MSHKQWANTHCDENPLSLQFAGWKIKDLLSSAADLIRKLLLASAGGILPMVNSITLALPGYDHLCPIFIQPGALALTDVTHMRLMEAADFGPRQYARPKESPQRCHIVCIIYGPCGEHSNMSLSKKPFIQIW